MTRGEAIRALILADPALRELATAGIDNQIAAALNTPVVSVTRRILVSQALRWSVAGRNLKLRAAAVGGTPPAQALAQGYLDLLASEFTEITVDAEFTAMLQQLRLMNVLTDTDVADLLARGVELISLAESHNDIGSPVSTDEISDALQPYRLDGRVGNLPE